MKPLRTFSAGLRLGAALMTLAFGSARLAAQVPAEGGGAPEPAVPPGSNAPSAARIIRAPRSSGPAAASMTIEIPGAVAEEKPAGTNDDIQVSFQGADIKLVVQWLM